MTAFILGLKNISFTNNNWLSSIDMTQELVSWYYFKNDTWRFPIGIGFISLAVKHIWDMFKPT